MFDKNGRLIPIKGDKVFSNEGRNFYKLNCKYSNNNGNYILEHGKPGKDIAEKLKDDKNLKNMLNGSCFYFKIDQINAGDIGNLLEQRLLKHMSEKITCNDENRKLKVIIQDKNKLNQRLKPSPGTGYDDLIKKLSVSAIEGLYFPLALKEYAVSSQRERMKGIISKESFCLSGPLEIATVLSEYTDLLIDMNNYSPVLCASGVEHVDKRLITCFKSYGNNLEFWVMTNNLMKGIEQISEQWSGGITFYRNV